VTPRAPAVVALVVAGSFATAWWIDTGELPGSWDWTCLLTLLTLGAFFSPWTFIADGALVLA